MNNRDAIRIQRDVIQELSHNDSDIALDICTCENCLLPAIMREIIQDADKMTPTELKLLLLLRLSEIGKLDILDKKETEK